MSSFLFHGFSFFIFRESRRVHACTPTSHIIGVIGDNRDNHGNCLAHVQKGIAGPENGSLMLRYRLAQTDGLTDLPILNDSACSNYFVDPCTTDKVSVVSEFYSCAFARDNIFRQFEI